MSGSIVSMHKTVVYSKKDFSKNELEKSPFLLPIFFSLWVKGSERENPGHAISS